MRGCIVEINPLDLLEIGCQVSGVRTDGGVRFWGFRRDPMAIKVFRDVEDLVLNGLEKTLEQKIPERERHWQVAEESEVFGADNEHCPQG